MRETGFRPKIRIQKKFLLRDGKHFRYYAPTHEPFNQNHRPSALIFNLDERESYNKHGKSYPYLNIQTERQLVDFLRHQWGYGEYLLIAFLKGREGCYIFWKGIITEDGWQFDIKQFKSSDHAEIEKIKDDIAKAETEDDKIALKEYLNFFKEFGDIESGKRYGFTPFLKSSGRRGEFHAWDEDELMPKFEQDPEDTPIKKMKEVSRARNAPAFDINNTDDINDFGDGK